MTMKKKHWLKTSECAERCGVSDRTVARWLREGDLKGVKLNGHTWRVSEEELEKFIEGSRVQPE